MKIKVSEATEIQLDWMVAKCEGYFEKVSRNGLPVGKLDSWVWVALHPNAWRLSDYKCYHPSTNWAQGGPIIEREELFIVAPYRSAKGWKAYKMEMDTPELPCWMEDGPTPLIAAMRCYVSSTLGEEVEIPGELAQ